MATTIYGKIECYSDVTSSVTDYSTARNVNEVYVQAYKFMQYLSGAGVVDLYTDFSGSGTPSYGVGYWDQTPRFGNGAFSVWRFKPNADRNWDWYLLIQTTSGSTNLDLQPANARPVRSGNNETDNGYIYCFMQAAFGLDVSGNSVSPWNGTIDLTGGASKGSTVWNTSSYVFPRANNVLGNYATNKQQMTAITMWYLWNNPINTKTRTHFFSDGNGLVIYQAGAIGNPASLAETYNVYYFGPYNMLSAISASNQGKVLGVTGSMGFLHFATKAPQNESNTNTFASYTIPNGPNSQQFGNPTAQNSWLDGGIFATTTVGVRQGLLSVENYHNSTYNPNKLVNQTSSYYIEKPYLVVSNEDSNSYGVAGYLDTPLLRSIIGLQSHDVHSTGLRAIFGGTTTVGNLMASAPWSGSNPPGTFFTRDGFNFTITNYNM